MKSEICPHGYDTTNSLRESSACPEGCLSNAQRVEDTKLLTARLEEVTRELCQCFEVAQLLDAQDPTCPGAFTGTVSQRLKKGVTRLMDWKASSQEQWNQLKLEELGKLLGVPLGVSIPESVLPLVQSMKALLQRVMEAIAENWSYTEDHEGTFCMFCGAEVQNYHLTYAGVEPVVAHTANCIVPEVLKMVSTNKPGPTCGVKHDKH